MAKDETLSRACAGISIGSRKMTLFNSRDGSGRRIRRMEDVRRNRLPDLTWMKTYPAAWKTRPKIVSGALLPL